VQNLFPQEYLTRRRRRLADLDRGDGADKSADAIDPDGVPELDDDAE
jgi:hypothetical protein